MIEVYKIVNNEITYSDKFDEGVWINLVNPNEDEIKKNMHRIRY
jgi:magnesium transporter